MWHASSASGAGGDVLALVRVERAQQADGERARRAEPGAGGDVGELTISMAGSDSDAARAPPG